MSLINDALRRASNASKVSGEASPPPLPPPPLPESDSDSDSDAPSEEPIPITADMLAPPLIPMESARRRSSKMPILVVVLILFCSAGAAGFRFWKKANRFSGSFEEKMEQKLALMETALDLAASNAVTNAISPATASTGSNSLASTAKPAGVVPVSAPKPPPAVPPRPLVQAVVANSTPAKFPPLRLQSIFYRPSNPSVMINGKLLCVADEIQGVLVADIQPSSVTLVLSGYTNVLTLR